MSFGASAVLKLTPHQLSTIHAAFGTAPTLPLNRLPSALSKIPHIDSTDPAILQVFEEDLESDEISKEVFEQVCAVLLLGGDDLEEEVSEEEFQPEPEEVVEISDDEEGAGFVREKRVTRATATSSPTIYPIQLSDTESTTSLTKKRSASPSSSSRPKKRVLNPESFVAKSLPKLDGKTEKAMKELFGRFHPVQDGAMGFGDGKRRITKESIRLLVDSLGQGLEMSDAEIMEMLEYASSVSVGPEKFMVNEDDFARIMLEIKAF